MRCVAWRVKVLAGISCDSPGLAGTRHATRSAAQRMWNRRLKGWSSQLFYQQSYDDARYPSREIQKVDVVFSQIY